MKWSAAAPWSGAFRPVPGASIAAHLRLVRPLTSPGARHVWVADHLVLDTEVAVKFCASPDGTPRFLQQARSTARIADPHLLQVLEHGKIKGSAFLVTELLEGRSLRQRLLTGPLTLAEARAVLAQTAGVLAKAHALGLWHGSVCPEHLFLTETAGEPFMKVSAFGDAFESVSEAAQGIPSSRAYLSPEQLLRGAGSGASSDLWALAVTLYELLTTTLPFTAPNEAALSVAICNAQFTPPTQYRTDLPPLVDAWFRLVLAKDPAARFSDPLEFAHEFAHATAPQHRAPQKHGAKRGEQDGRQAAASDPDQDDDEDIEERTQRWALPSDWAQPSSGGITRSLSSRSITTVSSGPPPLPNRAPSSRPPPPAWAMPAPLRELPRTTTPQVFSQQDPSPSRFAKTKGLLAGALLGAAGALAAWAYQSLDHAEAEPTPAGSLPVAARVTAEPAPVAAASNTRAAVPRAAAPEQDSEQLLVILNTDELPRAPDEVPLEEVEDEPQAAAGTDVVPSPTVGSPDQGTESDVGSGHASRTERANIPASVSAQAAAQSAGAAGTSRASANNEGNGSPRRATPAAAAVRRDTPHRAKPTSSADDCNPPYFFDENNIQRLKLECL